MNRTLARGQSLLRGWSLEAFVAGAAVGAWALRHRYRPLRDIAGQVVLITGGSRGLGFSRTSSACWQATFGARSI